MNLALKLSDKLHLYIMFSASLILMIAGGDVYLEHHLIPGADIFMGTAGFLLFCTVVGFGFSLTNSIIKPLHKAVDDLNMESSEVAAASSQVEAASHELAEASLEESASIQETAASLEETSSMVLQNNSNTQEATSLSKQSMLLAENSYSEMQKMLEFMEKLEKSSEEIFKVVKVIDNISFQTKILSLNASVEAARAGVEGNSFAIIAEEVRTLSLNTNDAAKKTEEIINNNIELTKIGLELAQDVENSLAEIDQESKKIHELMNEISIASSEQTKGISEIHKAIVQMELATNSNAHSANECACASKDLSSQADYVKEIVNGLNMLMNGHPDESYKDLKRPNMANFTPVKAFSI